MGIAASDMRGDSETRLANFRTASMDAASLDFAPVLEEFHLHQYFQFAIKSFTLRLTMRVINFPLE